MPARPPLIPASLCAAIAAALGAAAIPPATDAAHRAVALETPADDDLQFDRDVRPILAQHCFTCHGPDASAREAGLRLDVRDDATRGDPGEAAIVPGDPDASLLIRRVASHDESFRMPPAEEADPLTADEIETLRRWIALGAPWQQHWAFDAPARPIVPEAHDRAWVRNPIDAFVLRRLESEGLTPAPEADPRTLLRRVTLDLTGLPPTIEEIDAFLADDRPDAYERVVRRLLDSPHHGERMALQWLDLARYADTNGYSIDGGRHMWAWRDWVIEAFNDNMPFDRFTIEQLAGDLLPGATQAQRVASGFNRNHMITHEGGTILEEYRVAYVADRVRTTAQTWLGLTMGCAQCHDHKYDPISQRDYYRFFAFFNTITDRGNDGDGGVNSVPFIPVFSADQLERLDRLTLERETLAAALDAPDPALDAAQARWEADQLDANTAAPTLGGWRSAGPFTAPTGAEAFASAFPPEQHSDAPAEDGSPLWRPRPELTDGEPHPLTGANAAWYFRRTITAPRAQPLQLHLGSDDAIRVWFNGEPALSNNTQRPLAPDQELLTVQLRPGDNELLVKVVNYGGPAGFYFRPGAAGPPPEVAAALATPPDRRTPPQLDAVRRHFRANAPETSARRHAIERLDDEIDVIRAAPLTTTMVMEEMAEPRQTHLLERGRYDLPGEAVTPGVPEVLPPIEASTGPDRLALAHWIVDSANPLTARVAVNGYWQMLFGAGLVRTSEDFGVRGERPSHPELLDWLAVEFVERGWDVRDTLFLIATSATYRQSSAVEPALLERDPDNRLLARGPRFRLQAEFVRDLALAAGGLLVEEIGGPSARPYQPPGLWEEMSHFGSTPATEQVYTTDTGDGLYRRSMYTIWKRTVPPPTMAAFDAPNRELCISRRARTNTPIQALVLLNETGFVEAARALAQRMMLEGGDTPEGRIRTGFLLVTGREPDAWETQRLADAFAREAEAFAQPHADPDALLAVGESTRDPSLDPAEHAAWTVIAATLLNLSETLTRG